MKADRPHILLVNPWIHDFAAYDVWAQPLGLLQVGANLRRHGCRITYIDCLNRFHPLAPPSDPGARHGRGPYIKTVLPAPPGLEGLPRRFSRYGIPREWFQRDLEGLAPPDLILVTSAMTYWYPGVAETVRALKNVFPATPLVLGGIYATLCREHAEAGIGADAVISGPIGRSILDIIARFTGFRADPVFDFDDLDAWPYPAFELQHRIAYIPLLTSVGCPFRCAYCASHRLQPRKRRRDPLSVVAEIEHWHHRYGVRDFAFYDDALLVEAETHALPLLEALIRKTRGLRFHTPNALHIREISPEMAGLMFRAGFATVRLGLETAVRTNGQRLDRKVDIHDFETAARNLRAAGFSAREVGAYLLAGLPDQRLDVLENSILKVKTMGIRPILAYYSPIPHTALWGRAVAVSRYDLEADPIFTNNAIFPCQTETFSWEALSHLKRLALS
ncbi:MAG: radical SAM protein [Desulfosarcina sp.]|nr:radical SAM protein [Desulfobacterales bacterium]